MTEREWLRRHIEAVWDLTLPPIDETARELVLLQGLPPWSLYLGTFAQAQVALWRPDVLPEARMRLLEQANQAGDAWEEEWTLTLLGCSSSMRAIFCSPRKLVANPLVFLPLIRYTV